MVSEGVSNSSIVVVRRVIHIFSVGLSMWVAINGVISIIGEEQTIPCAVFLVLSKLLISVSLIVSLEHSSLGDVKIFLGNHSREGLEVRASEPGVLHNCWVSSVWGEEVTTCKAHTEKEESKGLTSEVAGVQVHEVVVVLVKGDSWDATLEALHAASDPHCKRWGKCSTDACVCPECKFVLVLNIMSILPGPSLRACHMLTGMKTDPWVVQELIVQPIISNYKIVVMEQHIGKVSQMTCNESLTSQGTQFPPHG